MVDIPSLLRRADAYAKAVNRTSGAISKELFKDSRTLDLLRDESWRNITISRLERAERNLIALEKQIAPQKRRRA